MLMKVEANQFSFSCLHFLIYQFIKNNGLILQSFGEDDFF